MWHRLKNRLDFNSKKWNMINKGSYKGKKCYNNNKCKNNNNYKTNKSKIQIL